LRNRDSAQPAKRSDHFGVVRNLIGKKCGELGFFGITGLKLVEDVQ
jgi:hypothetical protein